MKTYAHIVSLPKVTAQRLFCLGLLWRRMMGRVDSKNPTKMIDSRCKAPKPVSSLGSLEVWNFTEPLSTSSNIQKKLGSCKAVSISTVSSARRYLYKQPRAELRRLRSEINQIKSYSSCIKPLPQESFSTPWGTDSMNLLGTAVCASRKLYKVHNIS